MHPASLLQVKQLLTERSLSNLTGNIHWLFHMTEQSKQFLEIQGKPVPEHVKKVHDPYVHTRVITAYDHTNDHLVHKDCDFFVC